jgi:hypothetical protein
VTDRKIEYTTTDRTTDGGIPVRRHTWLAEHNGLQYGANIDTFLADKNGKPLPEDVAAKVLALDRLALERNAETSMAIVWNVAPDVLAAANQYSGTKYQMNTMLSHRLEKATLADVQEVVRLTDLVGDDLSTLYTNRERTPDQEALILLLHGDPEAEFKAKHGIV